MKRAAEEYKGIAATAAKGDAAGPAQRGSERAVVEGRRVYDLLLEWLDPTLVKFQFQMSEITAGLAGAEYFRNTRALQLDAPAGHRHERPGAAASPACRPARRPQVALGAGASTG